MKRKARRVTTQLAVIGTGIAGFAASLFARDLGLSVAQFGHSGAMAYTTGYFDLLGVAEGRAVDDPWAALARLSADHPMAGLAPDDIRLAIARFTGHLGEMGLGYTAPGPANLRGLLPLGVSKPTLCVPATIRPGIDAHAANAPTLLLDFEGLQGFSAREFQINIAESWPALRTARVSFPGMEGRQVFPEVMARALETRDTQSQLAALIRPLLDGATHVGLPAVLGIHAPDKVRAALEAELGVTLFEIPTIPPGVAGIRLRELFERELPGRGVALEPNLKVAAVRLGEDGAELELHGPMEDITVEAEAVILATGRFLSRGLASDRSRLRETLLNLPIAQPDSRADWYRPGYLDPRGHPINRLGVAVDTRFHPLDAAGAPVNDRLFAAGIILAGQDWARERSGAGLAIATAHAAVRAAALRLKVPAEV